VAHNETLQLQRKGLSAEVQESAAALETSRVRLEEQIVAERVRTAEREFKFEAERTCNSTSMAKLTVDLEQERTEHNKLKEKYAVPVHKGRAFELSSCEWLRENGFEVDDVHGTPHRGDALVTIPGFGLPVLIDFKNVSSRNGASKEMAKLIADAVGYGQRDPPVVIGGVIVVYPDSITGGATNCEIALTQGQTTAGSVGGIRADRKWFCPLRFLLPTLFKVVASHGGSGGSGSSGSGGSGSGTVHKFCYEDATCVKMITYANRVAQMPLAPLMEVLDAVSEAGKDFRALLKLRAELAVSMGEFTAANPVAKALQVALPDKKLLKCWPQPVASTKLLHSPVKLAAWPNPPLAAEPLDSAARKRSQHE
jgi:hypothetical protein